MRENVVVVGRQERRPAGRAEDRAVAETITVSGESPVIDTKATGTATNFTADELTKIPTSRDPFALMRSVPGVLVDRVNIGGNETGQQSNFASKGTRPQDAVWTMDGIDVTDMAATGASPTYYNYDNFEEIQVSTAGQDIKQPTGGIGLNLVVKRGTNQFHGGVRGYFDNDGDGVVQRARTSSRRPASRPIPPITTSRSPTTAFDLGGPDPPATRRGSTGPIRCRTCGWCAAPARSSIARKLKNPDVKLNWQATKKDMVSFLYFDGFKIKDGRSPGVAGILFDAPTATYHQDNAYTDSPLHGLWKIADDRVISSNMFVSAKYAYYNTGFVLDPDRRARPAGGPQLHARRQSFGSVNQSLNVRPQKVAERRRQQLRSTRSAVSHDLKYGFGFRTRRRGERHAVAGQRHPRDRAVADRSAGAGVPAGLRRQPRELPRLLRRRHDHARPADRRCRRPLRPAVGQGAAERTIAANPAFPNVVPGVVVRRLRHAVHVERTCRRARASPTRSTSRARPSRARASARYAGQLETGTVGVLNPSSTAGSATYRWTDLNSDHFAQANEVNLNQFITAAGGFNPGEPDRGDVAERARSESQSAEHHRASSPAWSASCGRTSP